MEDLVSERDFDRFWNNVDKQGEDQCWVWKKSRHPFGYGWFRCGDKTLLAHRVALFFASDWKDLNMQVLHDCNNPPCCNPKHLKWGTQKENIRDCIERNRFSPPPKNNINPPIKKGSDNGNSKLLPTEVLQIRKLLKSGKKCKEIASIFMVSTSTISNINTGKVWSHI